VLRNWLGVRARTTGRVEFLSTRGLDRQAGLQDKGLWLVGVNVKEIGKG
jgi:hypothetical protein